MCRILSTCFWESMGLGRCRRVGVVDGIDVRHGCLETGIVVGAEWCELLQIRPGE